MTEELSTKDTNQLRDTLVARREELAGEVKGGVALRSGEESVAEQAGDAPDSGDSSVAAEISDLRAAEIERDAAELQAIEVALARMDNGDYGICSTCGTDIPLARLKAAPTAERCIRCQTLWESQHASPASGASSI